MWKDFNNIEYDIVNNIFIIRKYDKINGKIFMQPLGDIDDDSLINIIDYLEFIRKKGPKPISFKKNIFHL